mmetsp:Transcript_10685/g.17542  ORF Transcript_10685/g.17542 Transcript_10685/m.17542 type:complete len:91 (+) Transcript_10685:83-355(+)
MMICLGCLSRHQHHHGSDKSDLMTIRVYYLHLFRQYRDDYEAQPIQEPQTHAHLMHRKFIDCIVGGSVSIVRERVPSLLDNAIDDHISHN